MYVSCTSGVYVTYKSWLRGVFPVYATWEPKPEAVSNVYSRSLRHGEYTYTANFRGQGLRVVCTRSTPCNYNSCNTYVHESSGEILFLSACGLKWRSAALLGSGDISQRKPPWVGPLKWSSVILEDLAGVSSKIEGENWQVAEWCIPSVKYMWYIPPASASGIVQLVYIVMNVRTYVCTSVSLPVYCTMHTVGIGFKCEQVCSKKHCCHAQPAVVCATAIPFHACWLILTHWPAVCQGLGLGAHATTVFMCSCRFAMNVCMSH